MLATPSSIETPILFDTGDRIFSIRGWFEHDVQYRFEGSFAIGPCNFIESPSDIILLGRVHDMGRSVQERGYMFSEDDEMLNQFLDGQYGRFNFNKRYGASLKEALACNSWIQYILEHQEERDGWSIFDGTWEGNLIKGNACAQIIEEPRLEQARPSLMAI